MAEAKIHPPQEFTKVDSAGSVSRYDKSYDTSNTDLNSMSEATMGESNDIDPVEAALEIAKEDHFTKIKDQSRNRHFKKIVHDNRNRRS